MLELPESTAIARQINDHLTGKIISGIKILQTPHRFAFFYGEQDKFAEYLEGQTITGAVAQGGMVQIDTQDSMIALNDGAYPRYYDDAKKFPKKHQFAVFFDDGTGIFVSIQMYGGITVAPKETARKATTSPRAQSPIRSRRDSRTPISAHCTRGQAKSCRQRRFSRRSSASPGLETVCSRTFCGMQASIRAFRCRTRRRRIFVFCMDPSIRS